MALTPSFGWGYYNELSISGAISDYQMKLDIRVGSSSNNDPTNGIIYDDNHCYFSTGSDVCKDHRFGSGKVSGSSSTIQLYEWTESITTDVGRVVWVNISSYSKIYLFAGNSFADEYSDGDNTFLEFEDFTGTDGDDPAGWTDANSYWQISGNTYQGSSSADNMSEAYINDSSITDMRIRAKLMITDQGTSTGDYIALIFRRQSNDANYWFSIRYNVDDSSKRYIQCFYWDGSANTTLFTDSDSGYIYQNTWHNVIVYVLGDNADMYVDGILRGSNISLGGYISSAGQVGLTLWAGAVRYADDFFVAKYASSEPAWSFGTWIVIDAFLSGDISLNTDSGYGNEIYISSAKYGDEIRMRTRDMT